MTRPVEPVHGAAAPVRLAEDSPFGSVPVVLDVAAGVVDVHGDTIRPVPNAAAGDALRAADDDPGPSRCGCSSWRRSGT